MNPIVQYNTRNHSIINQVTVVIIVAVSLLAVSCRHQQVPSDVMGHEAMVDFLTDAYLVEGEYALETQYRYDRMSEGAVHAYDSVLSVHGVSREDVERSLDYYSGHLGEYKTIHDEVVNRLETMRDSLNR